MSKEESQQQPEQPDPPQEYWGVLTDNGLCLTLGFTYQPPKGFAVLRLCDHSLIIDVKPDGGDKLRKLEENEWPSCKECRQIFKRMRDAGVR